MTVRLTGEAPLAVESGSEARCPVDPGLTGYGLACDIGTTTVVCHLLDLSTGALLGTLGEGNAQRPYGGDVIARIKASMDGQRPALTAAIIQQLSRMAQTLCRKAGIALSGIVRMAVAANTTMLHLLTGLAPDSLGAVPFTPLSLFGDCRDARALGLPFDAEVYLAPAVSGYVGGDITADLLALELDRSEAPALLIDVGTNGEMALGCGSQFLCCSTAAGPAFEGAGISCGMRGAVGAIDHVWLADGKISCHVIGEGKALGLCGSGLLDLVAVLLEAGVLDDSGFLAGGTYQLPGTAVTLTQKDVRQVQLAKAAICAGIRLMAKHLGIRLAQIQQVLLAGAFGNYLDPASACRIGMIPACLLERIQPIGNAAGAGAALCALRRAEFERSKALAETTEFLELAACPDFQDCYVDALELGVCEDDDL